MSFRKVSRKQILNIRNFVQMVLQDNILYSVFTDMTIDWAIYRALHVCTLLFISSYNPVATFSTNVEANRFPPSVRFYFKRTCLFEILNQIIAWWSINGFSLKLLEVCRISYKRVSQEEPNFPLRDLWQAVQLQYEENAMVSLFLQKMHCVMLFSVF